MSTKLQPTRRHLLLGALAGTLPGLARTQQLADDRTRLFAGIVPPLNEPGGAVERRARELAPPRYQAIEWMPWARAYASAARGNALLFPVIRTPAREDHWQWLAPLGRDRLVFVVSPAHADALPGSAEFRRLRVGAIRGSFIGERLAALGVEVVEFASSESSNARKLALGRIDAWATMEHVALTPENLACLPRGFALKPLDSHPFTMWLVASLDMRVTPRAG